MNENITPMSLRIRTHYGSSDVSIEDHNGVVIADGVRYDHAEMFVEACNAYPALTARVKELEEENARLIERGECLLGYLDYLLKQRPALANAADEIADVAKEAREYFAALNKEPTT